MSSDAVEKITRAVLYEGYLLYPYRQSALKNQQRWNFGVLYPPSWAANQTGSDRSYFQMECIALCRPEARIDISLRFLQIVSEHAGGRDSESAVEQNVHLEPLLIDALITAPHIERLRFPGGEDVEAGVRRSRFPLEGELHIGAVELRPNVFRLTARVINQTFWAGGRRTDALLRSLASAHLILRLQDGSFVSQVDPPPGLAEEVAACRNAGVWPVLVGNPDLRDTMLGSPIILYDYPQVAPESKGDLFDSTEIDEILTLRVLTLSDAEKEEVRRSDERARKLLERLETSAPEDLSELHGAIRSMRQSAPETAWSAWDTVPGAAPDTAAVA
ncbi:MAG: hypothetical protein JO319_15445, partial [Acidobacteriaceae bacterium]|nr:hypothetical protein [Acidobacteriaceae bacterium]